MTLASTPALLVALSAALASGVIVIAVAGKVHVVGVADQQDKRRHVGARVWLQLDSEERTTGVLLSTAEIGVVIREDDKPGVVVLPWSASGTRWGFLGPTED